jgi:succinate dehydrogenase / fumarate reductase iron-sulfur subunit
MFNKHRALHPYIYREKPEELDDPAGEHYQTPEQLEHYLQFTYCIKCGCCMGACPTLATDPHYLGPQPLAQAYRYNVDTRDGGRAARNKVSGDAHGAVRCHFAGECSRVCPKGVDPARAVQLLKRQLVFDYLRLAKKRTPCQLQHGPGKGVKIPNIPAPPARTVGA